MWTRVWRYPKKIRYRYRYFFRYQIFSDTSSETFFRFQIFSIPVPIPAEKIKNSRYWSLFGTGIYYKSSKFLSFGGENQFRYQIFRYRFRYQIFPILFSGTNFSDTGSGTTKENIKFPVRGNSRYREFPVTVRHTLMWTYIKISRKLTKRKKESFFGKFLCPDQEKFQVAADRTIFTPAGFPIPHLKAYALRFSGNI